MTEVKNYLKSYKHLVSLSFVRPKEAETLLKSAKEIENSILKIEDKTLREVLLRKYIYGDTNEQIAESLCYSVRHIGRLLNSALDEFKN